MYKHFEDIAASVKKLPRQRTMAIAGAADQAVIESALHAFDDGLATPIFVGDETKIRSILASLGCNLEAWEIVHAERGKEGQLAVDQVKTGKADFLMKGMIETREILGPVVKKENDLRTGAVMSHVVFFDRIPHRDRFIVQTDGGMIMYPTLSDKKAILENAVAALRAIGFECPRMAVLAPIETVNPKMIETVEANALKEMFLRGEIEDCFVEGPISYDIAMSGEFAKHKKFDCPYCGDFDALIMPNMAAGNILGKCWTATCDSLMGGIIMGAKVPIILDSRSSSSEEKYYAIAIAALIAAGSGS